MLGARILSATKWNAAGTLVRAALTFATQAALARLVGPDAYAYYAMFGVILSYGNLLSDGGFSAGLTQKRDLTDDDVRAVVRTVLLISTMLALGCILFSSQIAHFFSPSADYRPAIIVAAIMIIPQGLTGVPFGVMRRSFDAKRMQIIQAWSYLLGFTLIGIGLAVWGGGAWAIITGASVQIILVLGMATIASRIPVVPNLMPVDPSLRKFGWFVMLSNILNYTLDTIWVVWASRYFGPLTVGLYASMYSLTRAGTSSLTSVFQSSLFAATAIDPETDRQSTALQIVGAFAWPPLLFLAIAAEPFLGTVYGHRWDGAETILALLSGSMIFYTIMSVSGPVLWGLNSVRTEAVIQTGALVLAAGLLATVARIDINMLAACFAVVSGFRGLLLLAASARKAGRLRPVGSAFARVLLFSLGSVIPVLLFDRLCLPRFELSAFQALAADAAVFAASYALVGATLFRIIFDHAIVGVIESKLAFAGRVGIRRGEPLDVGKDR